MDGLWDDPSFYRRIPFREVPKGARVYGRQFRDGTWKILAQVGREDFLVLFDAFEETAGFRPAYREKAEVEQVLGFMELILDPDLPVPDPQIEERLKAVTQTPPFVPDSIPAEILEVDPGKLRDALEEIEYIEMGWLLRLRRGRRETCLCPSCRGDYVRRLDDIAQYFRDQYRGVPTEIRAAIHFTLRSWEAHEEHKPPVDWYAL